MAALKLRSRYTRARYGCLASDFAENEVTSSFSMVVTLSNDNFVGRISRPVKQLALNFRLSQSSWAIKGAFNEIYQQQYFEMSIQTASKTASLFASLMVLVSNLPANALQSLPASAPLPSTLPGLVSRRIQIDLASRLNVPAQNIVIKQATPQTWNDHCLGLANPDENCVQGMKKGWQVEVESSQQTWTYRSDRTASRLRLEPLPYSTDLNQADFSASLSQTLLETVSRQVQQPVENLQILQVQAATWDSCLGIAAPDTVCTASAIPGFKVIVNDGPKDEIGRLQGRGWPETRESEKEWVYHLSADATQIVQNTTASDLQGRVTSWLYDTTNQFEPLDSTVVFQIIIDDEGGGGFKRIFTLTTDGKSTVEQRSYWPGKEPILEEPVQIPLEKVASFEAFLQQQNFSNFDRMRYETENSGIVIHGTATVRTPNAIVGADAEEEDLPVGLQAILEAWSDLAY